MRRPLLDAEGRKLLEDLKGRERRSDFTEDDEEFFVKQRRLLEQDAKLCSRWEKALYGKPIWITESASARPSPFARIT